MQISFILANFGTKKPFMRRLSMPFSGSVDKGLPGKWLTLIVIAEAAKIIIYVALYTHRERKNTTSNTFIKFETALW